MAEKSVHVKGTFGAGGTVKLQGTNDGATTATFPAATVNQLNKPDGTNLSLTAEGLLQILENPAWIRPVISAGTGVSVTVLIVAKPMTRTL